VAQLIEPVLDCLNIHADGIADGLAARPRRAGFTIDVLGEEAEDQ
jgi:hypothetical protein